MRASNTSLRWFGSLLLTIAGTGGCSQAGTGDPASPTAPSAVAATSASSSQSIAVAMAGPGASYDASGSWHFFVRDKPNGNLLDEGHITFTQDAAGNLQSLDKTVTLKRRGTGQTIAYLMSIFEVHAQCNVSLSGPAELVIKGGVLKAHISGTEQDCSRVDYFLTAIKI